MKMAVKYHDEESQWLIPEVPREEEERETGTSITKKSYAAVAVIVTLFICSLYIVFAPDRFRETTGLVNKFVHFQTDTDEIDSDEFYLPDECPGGRIVLSGISDPRDVQLTSAILGGLGPYGQVEAEASLFVTQDFNKHEVGWLIVTKGQGDGWSSFQMVKAKVSSSLNNAVVCAIEAGEFAIDPSTKLDLVNTMTSWRYNTHEREMDKNII